ncbi:MAG: recombination helicase AddA, partial [Phycisphaerales bacterium]|nr:recombination helicase AddA [Phycisphaerales bacterium]
AAADRLAAGAGGAAGVGDADAGSATAPRERLPLPAFMTPDLPPDPAAAGAATHLVLQHLRFADARDWADVERQMDAMVDDRRLTAADRRLVDVAAVEWFLSTDVAALIRAHEPAAIREMPVYLAEPMPGGDGAADVGADPIADPADAVMVRGRVDLFLPLPDGGLLVDYKTDRLATGAAVDARAAAYRLQLRQYADAVGRIAGRPVRRSCLVFLRAQRIVDV